MEELKKELIELGYVDKVSKGSEGYSENMRDYAFIQLPKKGNSDLIKKSIEHGWKKEREFKLCSPFEISYSGYSIYISFKKFY